MKKSIIAFAAAAALGIGALAAPASAAPLSSAAFGIAQAKPAGAELVHWQKNHHNKHTHKWNKKFYPKKHIWHAGRYWRFVGTHGFYPGCIRVPGGIYCIY